VQSSAKEKAANRIAMEPSVSQHTAQHWLATDYLHIPLTMSDDIMTGNFHIQSSLREKKSAYSFKVTLSILYSIMPCIVESHVLIK